MKKNKICLFLDIDETLFYPLPVWLPIINEKFGLHLNLLDIELAGNLDNYFKNTPHYTEYLDVVDQLRSSDVYNKNLPIIDGALGGVNKLVSDPRVTISGYLTTRPDSIKGLTITELNKAGFPKAEVYMRPKDIDYSLTATWKLKLLQEFNNHCTDGCVGIIDDNLNLIHEMNRYNKSQKNKALIAILFLGPLTKYIYERQRNQIKYVANWQNIGEVLTQAINDLQPDQS